MGYFIYCISTIHHITVIHLIIFCRHFWSHCCALPATVTWKPSSLWGIVGARPAYSWVLTTTAPGIDTRDGPHLSSTTCLYSESICKGGGNSPFSWLFSFFIHLPQHLGSTFDHTGLYTSSTDSRGSGKKKARQALQDAYMFLIYDLFYFTKFLPF